MLILHPEKTLEYLHSQEQPLCEDIQVMMEAIETVNSQQSTFSSTSSSSSTVNVQASGTAMRFLTALCSITPGKWHLTGTNRLCQRPIKPLVDALRSLGANISYDSKEGYPPLTIIGNDKLPGGDVTIDGSQSSQYVSALMLIAKRFLTPLNIHIVGSNSSQPYINLTKTLIDAPFSTSLFEGDWSAAAFWYEINSLLQPGTAKVTFSNLSQNSLQGDKITHDIFSQIDSLSPQQTFHYDFRNNPDLVQPVVVTCVAKSIPFQFTGVENLRIKETDRLSALQTELRKLGYSIAIITTSDSKTTITYKPQNRIVTKPDERITITTYDDHRMAMAFAPLAILFPSITIDNQQVPNKSYPNFWEEIKSIGFKVNSQTVNESDEECCGLHTFCEKTGKFNGPTAEDYFEDEELDRFQGRMSDQYTDEEIEEFREVLYTMRQNEVPDWLAALNVRQIQLPDQLKDEAIMLI